MEGSIIIDSLLLALGFWVLCSSFGGFIVLDEFLGIPIVIDMWNFQNRSPLAKRETKSPEEEVFDFTFFRIRNRN